MALSVAEMAGLSPFHDEDQDPDGDSSKRFDDPGAQQELPLCERLEEGLNPEQIEVVRCESGPLRVLALAGSGKTECVSRRIARLVGRGTEPSRILAVTFSKKGALEMSSRIAQKFRVPGARVGTWHSLCLQILREDRTEQSDWMIEGERQGRNASNPKAILKEVLGWKGMDWKGADTNAISTFIGKCKANLYDPDSAGAVALAQAACGWQAQKAVQAFSHYNEALAEKGLLTFDDFMVFVARHLGVEEHRAKWAARWDHVVQDEGQDANRAQKHIAHLLARDHRNYMIVGDRNQSIYSFRGSSPDHIDKFHEDWPDGRTIVLPRNYRSGRAIIAAANAIIAKADPAPGVDVPMAMIGERDCDGAVRVLCTESLDDEASEVVNIIRAAVVLDDSKLSDHTVLFRTNAQSRALEEALLGERIPYIVVGGTSFYERKEVRDLLAYLRLADRRGTTDDIKRSINTPFRFLGVKFVERVMAAVADGVGCDHVALDWPGVVEQVAKEDGLQSRQRDSAREWAGMIRTMQETIDRGQYAGSAEDEKREAARPTTLLENVVRATRYIEYLNKEEGSENTQDSAAANVREMVRVAERFPTTHELLDYIDETIKSARKQRDDKQAGGQRVLLMSVHRSKGLEWPSVYVVGMNEQILPHVKGDPAEERRLAYVATTRARDRLVLSYVRRIATRAGVRDVEPSRFLVDTGLPLDLPSRKEFACLGS
jgi:DNA helicase-2/ATP-dependent DNA helicase PcrA